MTTTTETAHFRQHGFQVFEGVVPRPVVESIREFLEGAVSASLGPAKEEIGCKSDSQIVSYIGDIAKAKQGGVALLSKATRDTLSGHFALETRLSPKLWEIPQSAGFRRVASALLQSERLFMHMPPTARFVLPRNTHAGVPPHQDISYNKHMSHFVTLWVPLVDIDDDCGGVAVYLGSGREPEQRVAQSSSEFWQQGVPTGNFVPRHCKLRMGDVLALNSLVIHQSMPNKSSRTRFSIDFRLFGEKDSSTKHYLDLQSLRVIAPPQAATHANV